MNLFDDFNYQVHDCFGFDVESTEELKNGVGWNYFATPRYGSKAREFLRSLINQKKTEFGIP